MKLRILWMVIACSTWTLGCVGGGGGGDGAGGDGTGEDGGPPGAGGAGGQGGPGGAGGAQPGECAPGDTANLVAIFDMVAAAGGGQPAEANQVNCGTACAVLSTCLQGACGAGDQTAIAFSVNACLMACYDRDAAEVGAVLAATGMGACGGVDDGLCGDWFDPACDGGVGGVGGAGGAGGAGGGAGGMGGEPDFSDCDPDLWCPATACVLDCADEACARGCIDARCGPDGEGCRGCPMGASRPICDFCAAAGHDDVCSCDLEVVCGAIACGAACDDEDDACHAACAAPCEPRAGTPCVCTEAEVVSCL